MIHRVDDRLRDEVRRYRLVFLCTDCSQFEPDAGRCSLGYPNEDHVRCDLDRQEEVIFCKYFELA